MARKHPGQFPDPGLTIQHDDVAGCHAGAVACRGRGFNHADVVACEGRHLRKMRDHNHLHVACQHGEPASNLDRSLASNSGVHFIKDERRDRVDLSEHNFNGQHDT